MERDPSQDELAGKPRTSALLSEGMDMIKDIPAGWLESLAKSKAEVEAGKTVPLEPVLDRARASIARMKARRVEARTVDRA